MNKLILLSLLVLNSLFANDIIKRMDKAFLDSYKNYDLKCYYFRADKDALVQAYDKTTLNSDNLSRKFTLNLEGQSYPFSFMVKNSAGSNSYALEFDEGLTVKGMINPKDFYRLFEFGDAGFFMNEANVTRKSQVLSKIKLSKIKCNIEFAKSKAINLEGTVHVNVHPHTRYDYQGLTTDKVKKMYRDYKSYVLVDGANRQGFRVNLENFFSTGSYKLTHEIFQTFIEVPNETPLVISPAGYNDYTFPESGEVEVILTGGNHNYCIWNNTRNLMWGLFYSTSTAKLDIIYKKDSTVLQRSGIIPGLSYKRKEMRSGNLLATLFEKYPAKRKTYHNAYNYYFEKDFVLRFKGLYKSLKYTYQDGDYKVESIIKGNGTRDLEINLLYK
ncbi:MAG: hypothetical protein N4A33_11700 [Bacteriovoracaceae bacterium]|jgi:hypothetical protein|nr:hypothetical protein [Bacteriovoracaceae bacterium]